MSLQDGSITLKAGSTHQVHIANNGNCETETKIFSGQELIEKTLNIN